MQGSLCVALPMRSEERLPYWHFVFAREFFQPRDPRNRGIQSELVVLMGCLNRNREVAMKFPLFLLSRELDPHTHVFLAFKDSPKQFLV